MYIQLESLTYGDGAIDSTIATQSESRLGKLDFGVNFDRSTLCSNTGRRWNRVYRVVTDSIMHSSSQSSASSTTWMGLANEARLLLSERVSERAIEWTP